MVKVLLPKFTVPLPERPPMEVLVVTALTSSAAELATAELPIDPEPERVRVAAPVFVKLPLAPLMIPDTVPLELSLTVRVFPVRTTLPAPVKLFTEEVVVTRLISSPHALETEDESAMVPLLTRARTPALIVVAPVYVLIPERERVDVPSLIRTPVPLITPETVPAAFWVTVSVLL